MVLLQTRTIDGFILSQAVVQLHSGHIMDNFYFGIGCRIKKKRLELKLTRDKLAHMARISDKFLYDIEVGKKGMSAETLYKIAQALGVSADWLLEGADI